MSKVTRSQFIEKLHDLLEHPYRPDYLCWVTDHSFQITCNDLAAREALSPKWEFRSLSSFIRQLSYYAFTRLSDRRRSTERKQSSSGYIVFTHPSGFFKRGDNSQLPLIIRKTRNRPEKRRASTSSMPQEHEHSPPPPLPASHYQPQDYRSQYNPDGYRQHPNFTTPAFQPTFPPLRSLQQPDSSMPLSWRPYTPPTTNWSQPTSSASYAPISAHHQPQQRLSVGDFKLSPSTLGPSPRSKLEELGPPPRLRKANSTLSIQTTAHPSADDTYRSPYPTPTFSNYASHHAYSSSSSTTSPNLIPSGLPMAYEGPSPSSYTTGPSSSSYTHLSHGAPSGPSSTSAPVTLPSPTYSSSSSDHTPFPSESTTTTNTTTNTSVLDPRHLSRSSSTNPSSYFAPPPPPPLNRSHSHEQQVSWSPALRPILDNGGEHYPSSYGGNSR